jgi:hypothetical protein
VQLRDGNTVLLRTAFADNYDDYIGGFDYRPQADGTFFFALITSAIGGYTIAFKMDLPAEPPTQVAIARGKRKPEDFFSSYDQDTWRIQLGKGKAYDLALINDPAQDECGNPRLEVLDDRGRPIVDSLLADEPWPSSSFSGASVNIEDFLAPYTGLFHLRASCFSPFLGSYSAAVALDRSVPSWNQSAPPTNEDDLVVRGTAADRISSLAGDDVIYAGAGNDNVNAGQGSDAVFSGGGADSVRGGPGSDLLYGEAGNDELSGEPGFDQIWGEGGNDHIVFSSAYPSGQNTTRIMDFKPGADKINLKSIDADLDSAVDQAFNFVATRNLIQAGQLNYSYDEGTNVTTVTGHLSADGRQFEIQLFGRVKPSAGDFIL